MSLNWLGREKLNDSHPLHTQNRANRLSPKSTHDNSVAYTPSPVHLILQIFPLTTFPVGSSLLEVLPCLFRYASVSFTTPSPFVFSSGSIASNERHFPLNVAIFSVHQETAFFLPNNFYWRGLEVSQPNGSASLWFRLQTLRNCMVFSPIQLLKQGVRVQLIDIPLGLLRALYPSSGVLGSNRGAETFFSPCLTQGDPFW